MLKTKSLNRVTMSVTVLMLVAALLLWGRVEAVQGNGSHTMGYEDLLFDQSYVHTIDITMDNWDELIDTATTETYMECSITIDGEKYGSVAIRVQRHYFPVYRGDAGFDALFLQGGVRPLCEGHDVP